MSREYGVKNFIHIANEFVNPDVTTFEGIQNFLIGWYCFQYGTTPKDDKLLDMTVEELMVLYQMHRINNDPNYYQEQTNDDLMDHDDWVKKEMEEMGEEFMDDKAYADFVQDYDQKMTEKIRNQLPQEITTDFSKYNKDK